MIVHVPKTFSSRTYPQRASSTDGYRVLGEQTSNVTRNENNNNKRNRNTIQENNSNRRRYVVRYVSSLL